MQFGKIDRVYEKAMRGKIEYPLGDWAQTVLAPHRIPVFRRVTIADAQRLSSVMSFCDE